MSSGLKNSFYALVLFGTLIVGVSSARADAFEDEVEKVNVLSDTIAGIVSGMTTVAITPMGLGAAMKVFRHIVLNNV